MASREQIKYAMGRLEEINREKYNAIREDCTTSGPVLRFSEVPALIKSGTLKVRSDIDGDDLVTTYSDLGAIFDVSKYNKRDKFDEKKAKTRLAALAADYTKIKDELMLGDLKVALALVEKFQKAKF